MPVSEMEFLNAFFDLNEDVCMRAFPDGEKRGARPLLYRFSLKNIADYLPEMRAKNKKMDVEFILQLITEGRRIKKFSGLTRSFLK